MNRRGWRWLLLPIIWLVVSASLAAQNRDAAQRREPSHVPIPGGGISRAEAEKLIRERLGHAQELHGAHKLLDDILRNPQKYFSEKELQFIRKQAEEARHSGKPTPELVDRLRKWAEDQKQRAPEHAPFTPEQIESLGKILDEQKRQLETPWSIDPPPDAPPPSLTPLPVPDSPLPSPTDQGKDADFRQRMLESVSRFLESAGRNESLERAANDLERRRLSGVADWLPINQTREGLNSRLPQLSQSLRLDRLMQEGSSLFRDGRITPDVGGWRAPGLPDGALPRGPGSLSDSGAGAGVSAVLWIILGGVALFAVWKLLSVSKHRRGKNGAGEWRLGPWPVDPAAIRTRHELVQAFEYLTLLLLGPAARCWNHRDVASRLRDDSGERGLAAVELAHLYEQARYAPENEPMPDAAVQAARRHLCHLAGASAA